MTEKVQALSHIVEKGDDQSNALRNVCNSRNALKGEGVRRARGPGVESPTVESAAGLGWVLRTLQLANA